MLLCLTTTRSLSILQTIEKYRCTVLSGVPSMYKSLLNNKDFETFDLTSLKSGIVAGECVNQKHFIEISERCHVPYLQQSYGQTETSPAITFTEYDDPVSFRGKTVGKVIDGLELRIFDNEKQCEVANGDVGEIQVKGFNVLKNGYYKLEEENSTLYTEDNWLRTGDAGYLDENNYLFLTGRFKEMIIKNGENICPTEIEDIILNYDGIQQVKVLGVCDDFCGEAIAAVYRSKSAKIEQELIEFVKQHLADYKVPKYFIRFEDFPTLENGKIDIKKIKQIILKKLT
jgi:fatty-acyl-CoA synthase